MGEIKRKTKGSSSRQASLSGPGSPLGVPQTPP